MLSWSRVSSLGGWLVPDWLTEVTPAALRNDLFAGFTSATVVLPQAVAFAAIAGLPAQHGLYTALVIPVVAALFGSSRVMVSGPTLVISAVMFSSLSETWNPNSPEYIAHAITLTLLVGAFQFAFGILQLGRFVTFISHSVMIGFTLAAATLITLSQMKDAFGIVAARGDTIIETIGNLASGAGSTNPYAVTIASVTLLTLVTTRMLAPRIPGFVLALLAGTAASWIMGAESLGVKMVGALPSLIPTSAVPELTLTSVRELGEGAFAIALLGLLEAISIGRAFAVKTNSEFNATREILGQGLSNIVGSFFQCYAGSGSFTRSGVNYEAGAKTPLSAISSSVLLLLILLLVSPVFAHIPVPAIAGVILYVAFRLIDIPKIWHILATSRAETAVLSLTYLAGLLVDLEFAIYGGVITSLLIFLTKTARPNLAIGAPDMSTPKRQFRNVEFFDLPECPQAIFVRLDGPLYFGSVDFLEKEFDRLLSERPHQRILVLTLRGVGDIDLPGAELIIAEAKKRRALGGDIYVAVRFPPLKKKLERFRVIDAIGPANVGESNSDAIKAIFSRMDPEVCRTCKARIFLECPRPRPVEDSLWRLGDGYAGRTMETGDAP